MHWFQAIDNADSYTGLILTIENAWIAKALKALNNCEGQVSPQSCREDQNDFQYCFRSREFRSDTHLDPPSSKDLILQRRQELSNVDHRFRFRKPSHPGWFEVWNASSKSEGTRK